MIEGQSSEKWGMGPKIIMCVYVFKKTVRYTSAQIPESRTVFESYPKNIHPIECKKI